MLEGSEVLWVHTYIHAFFSATQTVLNDARVFTNADNHSLGFTQPTRPRALSTMEGHRCQVIVILRILAKVHLHHACEAMAIDDQRAVLTDVVFSWQYKASGLEATLAFR